MVQIFSAPALGMPWGTGWIPEPLSSQIMIERIALTDRTLKLYDGLYHELIKAPLSSLTPDIGCLLVSA